ncbi:MAG: hypothetical protein M3Y69_05845, partial [Verrucomicrobiota bacterium]|nr:hypothetical protein [Verrucomicrobiota bacterium]
VLGWTDDRKVHHFGRYAIWHARLAQGVISTARTEISAVPRRLLAFRKRLSQQPKIRGAESPKGNQPSFERDIPSFFQWAAAGYRRQPYSGAISLLLSEDVANQKENAATGWQRLASENMVYTLPGTHLECITDHVETLAGRIESILQSKNTRD